LGASELKGLSSQPIGVIHLFYRTCVKVQVSVDPCSVCGCV